MIHPLRRLQALPALATPHLRWYFLGQPGHILGIWVLDIAINLVAWQLAQSAAVLGAINFLLYGPVVLLAPQVSARMHAGNVRRIGIVVLCGSALVTSVLLGLQGTGALTLPWLIALAAARGVTNGAEGAARQSLMVLAVSAETQIGPVIALNNLCYQIARLAGPALAAALIAAGSAAGAFAFGLSTSLFMLVCMVRMPALPLRADRKNAPRVRVREVLVFLRHDRFGSLFLPTMTLLALFGSTYQTLIPVLAARVFGQAELWTGAFFAAAGSGGLAAGLLLSTGVLHMRNLRLLAAAPWLVVVALLGLGHARWWPVAIACFVCVGFGMVFVAISANSGMQQRMPAHLRPGLVGVIIALFAGMTPVAQALAGAVAQLWGPHVGFSLFGATLALALLALFGPRWWRHRGLDIRNA